MVGGRSIGYGGAASRRRQATDKNSRHRDKFVVPSSSGRRSLPNALHERHHTKPHHIALALALTRRAHCPSLSPSLSPTLPPPTKTQSSSLSSTTRYLGRGTASPARPRSRGPGAASTAPTRSPPTSSAGEGSGERWRPRRSATGTRRRRREWAAAATALPLLPLLALAVGREARRGRRPTAGRSKGLSPLCVECSVVACVSWLPVDSPS